MKLKALFEKVKVLAAEKKMKRDEICRILCLSISTYLKIENGQLEESIPTMSKRQKMANAVVVAKLARFAEQDVDKWLKDLFPDFDNMSIQHAIKKASEQTAGEVGADTELTLDDLEFIKTMMVQSTKPLTFKDIYELLCRFRAR